MKLSLLFQFAIVGAAMEIPSSMQIARDRAVIMFQDGWRRMLDFSQKFKRRCTELQKQVMLKFFKKKNEEKNLPVVEDKELKEKWAAFEKLMEEIANQSGKKDFRAEERDEESTEEVETAGHRETL